MDGSYEDSEKDSAVGATGITYLSRCEECGATTYFELVTQGEYYNMVPLSISGFEGDVCDECDSNVREK